MDACCVLCKVSCMITSLWNVHEWLKNLPRSHNYAFSKISVLQKKIILSQNPQYQKLTLSHIDTVSLLTVWIHLFNFSSVFWVMKDNMLYKVPNSYLSTRLLFYKRTPYVASNFKTNALHIMISFCKGHPSGFDLSSRILHRT